MSIVIPVNKAPHSNDPKDSDIAASWKAKSDEEVIEIIVHNDIVEEVVVDEMEKVFQV
eukprot:CAMPEP_0171649562 /NCGR_PEP_ID=MMETSP0990-20121206/36908_1 /TAXON_ID=483369 /ORGANISM="non described non described, Strain CCMP2098" /LENGTH=57 /DNA_ID=CAMNT_0012227565 /DNA_START=271 /DNA_END=444 /DNA_ORIENTATION=+